MYGASMRISLIGPVTPYRGGIAHFTTQLAKRLMDTGHDIQVISFKKQYPQWLYPGESDKDFSPGRERVEAEYILTPLNPFTWRKTVKTINAFDPDKVIIPWWVTFWGPAFHYVSKRLKRRGHQISFLIHNTMPHEKNTFDYFLVRITLRTADTFIVMTEKERKRLLSLMPDIENIYVVPMPVYNTFTESTLSKFRVKAQIGLPMDRPILLFFGFVRPYKGLDVLIQAVKILANQRIQVHLLVAGEFWQGKKETKALIHSLGLSEHISIHDAYIPDNEVAKFFKASDLFIAPYINGTQSAALRTALGFGLPVVLTDVIVDEMIFAFSERCKVVKTGDPIELAKGICEQFNKPILGADQVKQLIKNSWQDMIRVIEMKGNSTKL
jgi:glycosyltransferase involved in cell wall biosynthesis